MDELMMQIHQPRPNLLDVVIEKAAAKSGPSINRMLYIAKLPTKETSKQRVVEWHEQTLKTAGPVNKMSGFLMVYPTCVMHFLEAETHQLLTVIKALRGEGKLEPILEGVCMLTFTEQAELRAFPSWMNVFVKSDNLGPYEYIWEDFNVLHKVSEMNINMLRWGRLLTDMDKDERVLALESLRASAEDLLPYDPAEIYALLQAGKTPKLDEFWDLMTSSMTMVFDSEYLNPHKVWPMMELPLRLFD